jgi:hypothetical protein
MYVCDIPRVCTSSKNVSHFDVCMCALCRERCGLTPLPAPDFANRSRIHVFERKKQKKALVQAANAPHCAHIHYSVLLFKESSRNKEKGAAFSRRDMLGMCV